MNGRPATADHRNGRPDAGKDAGKAPEPAPVPDEEEEDGDIATPKRDRDDEAVS